MISEIDELKMENKLLKQHLEDKKIRIINKTDQKSILKRLDNLNDRCNKLLFMLKKKDYNIYPEVNPDNVSDVVIDDKGRVYQAGG